MQRSWANSPRIAAAQFFVYRIVQLHGEEWTSHLNTATLLARPKRD
jgi:hypothetical protein